MPGTIVLKPLEAKIALEASPKPDIDSYCIATVGKSQVKSSLSRNGGQYPCWEDAITVRTDNEFTCLLELADQEVGPSSGIIGATEIDLKEVAEHGRVTKWYELYNKDKQTGQILLEIAYSAGEYPTDHILHAESMKLSGDDHTPKAADKIRGHGSITDVDATIPEEEEEAK